MAIVQMGTNPMRFQTFDRLRQEVNRLFNVFSPGTGALRQPGLSGLELTDDGITLYPGYELLESKRRVWIISFVEGQLLLRGERKIEPEEQKAGYHRRERESVFFRRTIALHRSKERIDPGKVSAGMKNGVLTVTLPRAERKPSPKNRCKDDISMEGGV